MASDFQLNKGLELPTSTVTVTVTVKQYSDHNAFEAVGEHSMAPGQPLHPLAIRKLLLDALATFAGREMQLVAQRGLAAGPEPPPEPGTIDLTKKLGN